MNKIFDIAQTVNRQRAKDQGFFDGRFRSRIVTDKKKNEHRKLRRQKPDADAML